MNLLLSLNALAAHCAGRAYLVLPWLGPSGLGLGILGTRSGLQARGSRQREHARGWWLILLVAWLPLLYWILAQFLPPD